MLKNVPIVNNIIITTNIYIYIYIITIVIFVSSRHEMIITRIIVAGTIFLINFETAARVGSQREIDWETTAAVEAKMFPQKRRHNCIPTCCLRLRDLLITGDH